MARTLAPSEMNKQGTVRTGGGSSSDQGCWFLSARLRYILSTPTVFSRPLFTLESGSLWRGNLDTTQREKKCDFSSAALRGRFRHPVKLSWKERGGRSTLRKLDLDYFKGETWFSPSNTVCTWRITKMIKGLSIWNSVCNDTLNDLKFSSYQAVKNQ